MVGVPSLQFNCELEIIRLRVGFQIKFDIKHVRNHIHLSLFNQPPHSCPVIVLKVRLEDFLVEFQNESSVAFESCIERQR